MQRKTQSKLVIICIIIGTIIISLMGYVYINKISSISDTDKIIQISKKCLVLSVIIFISLTIIFSEILRKIVKKSMVSVVRDAGRMVKGDETSIKLLQDSGKSRNEFMLAFDEATMDIREHLKDVDRQKRQIETILLHMTDGILAFNTEGEITHKNLAAERLLNLSEEDDNFEKIFSKLDVDINLEKIIYLEDWTSSDKKVRIGDKYLNILFVPYKDNLEKTAGVISVIQDITEHVKLDNMRKEFVADVSHELKTPITSIMGYADTLLEGEYDDATKTKFLNVIASEARRMAKLVTDLLALSRYDNNKSKVEKTEFDLGELVKKCQEKLQIEIDKKHHKVENLVTANVPLVYADRSGIERVVLNILSNSIKYTKENGNIKILKDENCITFSYYEVIVKNDLKQECYYKINSGSIQLDIDSPCYLGLNFRGSNKVSGGSMHDLNNFLSTYLKVVKLPT